MKKIFLFLLIFSSIGFSQLVKPSAGGATKDSLIYTLPKTIGNNFLSPSFYAKTSNVLYGLFSPSNPLIYSDTYGNCFFNASSNSLTNTNLDNLAWGFNCLKYINTAGSYNIGIGYQCIDANSNDSYNVAIGYNTYHGNLVGVHGSSNNLIGQYSLALGNPSSSNNILGNYGMYQGGGNNNSLLGNYCMYQSGGDSSIAIGLNALYLSGQYGNLHNNICIGTNAGRGLGYTSTNGNHDIYVGNGVGQNKNESYTFRIGDINYSQGNFLVGNFDKANLYLKANLNIDSSGMVLKYHSTISSANRTAGFDSVLSANTVDTIFTTAYDSTSIINITEIQNGAGTINQIAWDRQNSKPNNYFIVRTNALISNALFNWFILKTY